MKYFLIAFAALNLSTLNIARADHHEEGKSADAPKSEIARKKDTKSCPHCKTEGKKGKSAQKQHEEHGHDQHPHDQHDAEGAGGATGGTGATH